MGGGGCFQGTTEVIILALFLLGWSEATENSLSNFILEGAGPAARVLVSGWEEKAGGLTI